MDTDFALGDRIEFVGPETYHPWLIQGGISEVIGISPCYPGFIDVRIEGGIDVRIEGPWSDRVPTAHDQVLVGVKAEYFVRLPEASEAPFQVGQIVRCLDGEDDDLPGVPELIVTGEDYEVTDAYLGSGGETWFLAVRHTLGGPVTGGWFADRFEAVEEEQPYLSVEPDTEQAIYDAGYEDGAEDVENEIREFIKERFAQHPVFADERNAFDNGARYILELLADELLGEAIRARVVVELVPQDDQEPV